MTDWTNPKTWEFDELVDENELNTHLRDNILHLKELLGLAFIFTNRQGGSSTDWNVFGTTTYSITSPKIQIGCASIGSISTAWNTWYYGSTSVTFPVAFTNKPLVFCTCNNLVANNLITLLPTGIVKTGFTLQATSNGSMGSQTVAWLAIGE